MTRRTINYLSGFSHHKILFDIIFMKQHDVFGNYYNYVRVYVMNEFYKFNLKFVFFFVNGFCIYVLKPI